jgi:hypothetical protein
MLEPPAQNQDVRYEKSDANVAAIFAFAIGLGLVILLVQVGVAWLFAACKEDVRREDVPLTALAAKGRTQLPRDLPKIAAPRLQQEESADLKRLRDREEIHLKAYGWIDAEVGVVHIPIAEAMRRLADPKTAERYGIRIEAAKKKGGR